MLQLRPKVLIGFAEAVAGPESAFSLLAAGFEVLAFTRRGARPSLRLHPGIQLYEVTPPLEDHTAARSELVGLLQRVEPDVVLPLDDGAVWLCDRLPRDWLARVAGPTGDLARLALDKRLQVAAAERAGFDILPTRAYATADEIERDRATEFPLVIKPALSIDEDERRTLLAPISVCAGGRELRASLPGYRARRPVIVQPYVRGPVEGMFGLARHGELLAPSAHRRLRGVSAKGSTSACVSRPVDTAVEDATRRLVADVGWHGIFMLELVRDQNGRARFLELNGRAWGSMALSRRMGFEYPAWAVRQALDPSFTPELPPPFHHPITCRHLGREVLHLLSVMRGPPSSAVVDWPRRTRALRDVVRLGRGDCWYNLDAGTRRLFAYDAVNTVRRELSSKLRSR